MAKHAWKGQTLWKEALLINNGDALIMTNWSTIILIILMILIMPIPHTRTTKYIIPELSGNSY